ncbi:hypothetical protein LTS18_006337 [Coniosporium uncinatum]|uniref:Uncharacterized protein n=1 Tax=Coniosporium uncinatum TaxID=93489 RepID=A0ACC3D3Q8_9PEZI|nr:hypothetical protein LTS18_006337 [Coniosporium uncinatum]
MPCHAAIASMSLGRAAQHDLTNKLNQARKYGFKGIELFYEDIEHFASQMIGGATETNIELASKKIWKLCDERDITIICLQPFMHYEGLKDRKEHERKIEKMRFWLRLAKILRTDIIQIPSNFLPKEQITDNMDVIVSDLRQVADMGAQQTPVIRFAYESLCWGTYIDTWEACWDVIQRVDRPNFGACLDTYNICGRIYADPTSPDGMNPNADEEVEASIQRMIERIEADKVFFVQVVDAERLKQPLLPGHEFYNEDQPSRMSWSRNCRLFYGEAEEGAYLPIKRVIDAWLNDIKYEGWVSMELFNRCMAYPEADIPEQLARRGAVAWNKMVHDFGIEA